MRKNNEVDCRQQAWLAIINAILSGCLTFLLVVTLLLPLEYICLLLLLTFTSRVIIPLQIDFVCIGFRVEKEKGIDYRYLFPAPAALNI